MNSLPPANEVCKGYIFTPVCQSFCFQGVSASVHAGIHTPLRADTPLEQRPPGSRHPPEADTPLEADTPSPEADTPWEADTPPCAVHAGRYGQHAGILLESILVEMFVQLDDLDELDRITHA